MNSHVFLSEGCRLAAFCPATVDGVHAVYYEECSLSNRVSSAVAASSTKGDWLVEQKPKRTPRRMTASIFCRSWAVVNPHQAGHTSTNFAITTALKTPSSASLLSL